MQSASVFCDRDEYIAPQEDYYVTLTYALVADGGIVLAADSQITHPHDVGQSNIVATYAAKRSKIRTLKNGAAFSVAGNAGLVDALLAKAEIAQIDQSEPFEDVVSEYQQLFQREYLKRYGQATGPSCAFLFCGYIGANGTKKPQIIKLSSNNVFMWNPVGEFGFTGREQHGGVLYLHHRLYSSQMPLDSAKCLVYCIISEVAELDNIVDGPIEMVVVTELGVEPFTSVDRYEKKRQQIIGAVRSMIHSDLIA